MYHLIFRVARRAAPSFESRYARLLVSMSLEQAKDVLGFPPSYTPSSVEIIKAYRQKAFENHPDRGGDTTKMVEINVAKDILEGRGRATWEPIKPQPKPKEELKVEVEKGQTFEQAKAGNAVPVGTEWKFISAPQNYWSDATNGMDVRLSHRVWTLYGQTDKKHVFLAVKLRSGSSVKTGPGTEVKFEEDWQFSWMDAPIAYDILKVAPKYLKMVGTGWEDGNPYPPRKFSAWPGDKLTERAVRKAYSGGVALKNILVGMGLVNEGAPGASKQKTSVDIRVEHSLEKKERRKAQGKYQDRADAFEFFVLVNGREVRLEDKTVDAIKNSIISMAIGWDKLKHGRVYRLSRLRGGRTNMLRFDAYSAIKALAEALTTEPSALRSALLRAAEEYVKS